MSEAKKGKSLMTNSQKWECCETGYVSTAAGVVSYQKGKGMDTSKSNRKQISTTTWETGTQGICGDPFLLYNAFIHTETLRWNSNCLIFSHNMTMEERYTSP